MKDVYRTIDDDVQSDEPERLPIFASGKTGLSAVEDEIKRQLPASYDNSTTVQEVLEYLIAEPSDEEREEAYSINRTLQAHSKVVVVNNRQARVEDHIGLYVQRDEEDLGDDCIRPFYFLEIEVSAVKQGGNR